MTLGNWSMDVHPHESLERILLTSFRVAPKFSQQSDDVYWHGPQSSWMCKRLFALKSRNPVLPTNPMDKRTYRVYTWCTVSPWNWTKKTFDNSKIFLPRLQFIQKCISINAKSSCKKSFRLHCDSWETTYWWTTDQNPPALYACPFQHWFTCVCFRLFY